MQSYNQKHDLVTDLHKHIDEKLEEACQKYFEDKAIIMTTDDEFESGKYYREIEHIYYYVLNTFWETDVEYFCHKQGSPGFYSFTGKDNFLESYNFLNCEFRIFCIDIVIQRIFNGEILYIDYFCYNYIKFYIDVGGYFRIVYKHGHTKHSSKLEFFVEHLVYILIQNFRKIDYWMEKNTDKSLETETVKSTLIKKSFFNKEGSLGTLRGINKMYDDYQNLRFQTF